MAFTVASTVSISDAQKSQFEELGYTIVPDALDPDSLQTLREECAYFVGYIDGSMKARGRETYGITHRGKRYFISNRYRGRSARKFAHQAIRQLRTQPLFDTSA